MVAFFQVFLPKCCIHNTLPPTRPAPPPPPTLHNKIMLITYGVQDNYDTFPYVILSNLLLLLLLPYIYSPQYPALRNPKSMLRVKKPSHYHTKL
jgi:hypothetical protein